MTHHETPVDEKIRQEHEEAGVTPETEEETADTADVAEEATEETEETAEEPEMESEK